MRIIVTLTGERCGRLRRVAQLNRSLDRVSFSIQELVMKTFISLMFAASTLLWSGCCSTHQTTPTTDQHRMTHEELVDEAIEQLKKNNISKDMLGNPVVRDAAVVYFTIQADSTSKPDSNGALVLDIQTGEQISARFSSDPLLKEYVEPLSRN